MMGLPTPTHTLTSLYRFFLSSSWSPGEPDFRVETLQLNSEPVGAIRLALCFLRDQ